MSRTLQNMKNFFEYNIPREWVLMPYNDQYYIYDTFENYDVEDFFMSNEKYFRIIKSKYNQLENWLISMQGKEEEESAPSVD